MIRHPIQVVQRASLRLRVGVLSAAALLLGVTTLALGASDPGPLVGCLATTTVKGKTAVTRGQLYNVAPPPATSPTAPCNTDDTEVTFGKEEPAHDPANVIWVAPAGGDFTSVGDALASITDSAADNRYLVKIAPGVYTEEGGVLLDKSYVDIEGSGQLNTVITCACAHAEAPTNSDVFVGTLRVQTPANGLTGEVRDLSIVSTGGDNHSVAVTITNTLVGGTFSLRDVTVVASGGANTNYGIFNWASSPTLTHVTANANGGGGGIALFNFSSSSVTVRESSLTGVPYFVVNLASEARVANTQLAGIFSGTGLFCFNTYRANMTAKPCLTTEGP